jgi:hypothetical protein
LCLVIRRTAIAIACAAALSGCATFTQDDVVASVDDADLEQADFDARYTGLAPEASSGRYAGDLARTVITSWIIEQVLDQVGLIEFYEQGPETSGITCVSLVRPTDIVAAQEYVDRLERGLDWTDFVAANFPETPDEGDVSCIPTATLGPLAFQLAGMSLERPYAVFLFDDQSVAVLRMRPTAEVDPLEIAAIAQAVDPELLADVGNVLDRVDVTVDPQFGRFDPEAGAVVAIG